MIVSDSVAESIGRLISGERDRRSVLFSVKFFFFFSSLIELFFSAAFKRLRTTPIEDMTYYTIDRIKNR